MPLTDLKKLLEVSDALARLNHERYNAWDGQATKACGLAFDGPAYKELQISTLRPHDLEFAQQHLRILSGLYGVLRPMDGIRPYRLDMGKKLKLEATPDLYTYWGSIVTAELNRQVAAQPSSQQYIVNCASQEYFKVVKAGEIECPIYHMGFPGPSVYAKQARGAMARYIIQNQILDPQGLKGFTGNNGEWRFDPKKSLDTSFVFTRNPAKPKSAAASLASRGRKQEAAVTAKEEADQVELSSPTAKQVEPSKPTRRQPSTRSAGKSAAVASKQADSKRQRSTVTPAATTGSKKRKSTRR